MARRRLLLLQLCAAVAAASSLLAAALPPPTTTRDACVAPRTAAACRGARRLGPPHRLRVLSDIPADAPAAAAGDDYDMPADAPAAAAGDYDYDYDNPADAAAPAAGDGIIVIAADSPFPVAGADDIPADAAAGHSLDVASRILLFFIAALGGVAIAFFVASLVQSAALLASAVAERYAAAKAAHEKATRVRPLDQDAVEATAGH